MRYILLCLVVLMAACSSGSTPPTPTIEPTPVPSLTPTDSPTATLAPTAGEVAPEVTAEPTPLSVVFEASEGQSVPPPLDITLPEGWQQFDSTVAYQDLDAVLRVLPFTAYYGPVTGGTGYITVLWGFPSAAAAFGGENIGPGYDGVRLLRLTFTDIGCNIGTDLNYEREFTIGDRIAEGTYFSVIQCPQSVDTRGWFAGINIEGLSYVFYMYAEPIDAMDGAAEDELQAILDTVRFNISNVVITMTPE